MSIFLSAEDLVVLTGKKYKKSQIKVLERMQIPFVVNAAGRAVVTIAAINEHRDLKNQLQAPKGVWKSNKVKS